MAPPEEPRSVEPKDAGLGVGVEGQPAAREDDPADADAKRLKRHGDDLQDRVDRAIDGA
ncbi:MAG TPA: hypothetical protein VIO94_09815 [Phenylobacterium sp.]